MIPPTCNGPIPLPAAHIRVTLPDLSDDPLSHKNVGDAHYYIERAAIAYSECQCTLIWIYRLKVPYIEDTLDTTDGGVLIPVAHSSCDGNSAFGI